jgi:hypothetical protein
MQTLKRLPMVTILTAAIILGLGYVRVLDSHAQADKPKPFTGIVIDAETAVPFDLVATVMEINSGQRPNVVVAEKIIQVTEYKLSGQIFRTQVINSSGLPLAPTALEIGQRVIVTGIELPDKTIVGEKIQVKPK